MTHEEFLTLTRPEIEEAIAARRHCDPVMVALERQLPEARLVATQVKYLQRAEAKLPTYAAAQCLLPGRAFEQASSEACAAWKSIEGESVLDLTCGLGADAAALARRFRRVVTLERDEVLAEVARENFRRLGLDNIEVVATSAEKYLQACTERFDWVYADPDRRDAQERKQVRLEDCSPSIPLIYNDIKRVSERLCLKNSPLFDVDEAQRLFPRCRVEVVSLAGECKEVMIYDDGCGPEVAATALGLGRYAVTERVDVPLPERFRHEDYRYLLLPDVALQKGRLARQYLADVADIWSDNGFAFSTLKPESRLVRYYEIDTIEPYDPRHLRRTMSGGVEILKRDFPLAMEEIRRRTGLRPGSEALIALTKIGRDFWTIHLKQIEN